jgi:uncharacterized membrane protein YdbT with pleckstrin-like domain
MSYADTLLARDEHILYRARQHWLAPLSDSRNGLLLFLAGIVLMSLEHWVLHWTRLIVFAGVIVALVGLGWMGIVYATWRAQEYLITNRRAIKVDGLLDKKAADSSLEKINDAVLSQGLLARILKYGDLEILTASEEAIDCYQMLNRPVDFKKAMLDAKNQLEDGVQRYVPPVAPAAQAARQMSADDVAKTLASLADLRDKGAITPAEYEAKKAELLGRI